MIRLRFSILRAEKELDEGRKLTLRTIEDETGISLRALLPISQGKVTMFRFETINTLCKYFNCTTCELLEYVPDVAEGES